MSDSLKIGIAGLGIVGAGVVKILAGNSSTLAKKAGKKLQIVAVSARDKKKKRGIKLAGIKWHDSALALAKDPEIDVIVELIGGDKGVAYELCKTALKSGKHVVTANKALIAARGMELAELAEKNKVALLFEASVAGGIPIIKALKEGLAANNIKRVTGILNGTSNFILSAMADEGRPFDKVLREAQKLGYAESDPSFDINGKDAAHKLAILTALAHGCRINSEAIYTEGINNVSPDDIAYANELGFTIRPLSISRMSANGIEQRVHPSLVRKTEPIASVNGVLGAVLVECDQLGPAFFTGAGAGQGPTASAVVADIIDIASERYSLPFGVAVSKLAEAKFSGIENHKGSYYVRLNVKDKPGVLASITAAFSKQDIGVEAVLQKANTRNKTAQIALTTHHTNEKSIRKVLKNISEMEYVVETPHMIRIEEF